jgi:hypothetical protein
VLRHDLRVYGVDGLRAVLQHLWRRHSDADADTDKWHCGDVWSGREDAAVQHAGVRVSL